MLTIWRTLRKCNLPQAHPFHGSWLREIDDEPEPADKGAVHVHLSIRGEDGDALESLHSLQEVVDLDVRKAVVRVLDLRALTEQGVSLVSVSPMYLLTTPARSTR